MEPQDEGQKGAQKQKLARTAPKNALNKSWALHSKTRLLRQIVPENSPECSQNLWHLSGPVLHDAARLSQRYPPIVRYGVFGVSTWPIGCDTPLPLF